MGAGPEHAYADPTSASQPPVNLNPAGREYSDTRPGGHTRGGLLRRGWRKMTWVLIGYSTVTVLVALASAGSAGNKIHSACQSGLGDASTCQQLSGETVVAHFEHVMKLGLVGFAVLAVIWFMTRAQNQRQRDESGRRKHDTQTRSG